MILFTMIFNWCSAPEVSIAFEEKIVYDNLDKISVCIHMIDGAGSPGSSMFKLCLACRWRVRVEIYQIQIWPSRKNGSGNSDPGVHTGSSSDLRENIGAGSDPLETEYFIRMLPRKKIGYNPLEKIGSGDWWL